MKKLVTLLFIAGIFVSCAPKHLNIHAKLIPTHYTNEEFYNAFQKCLNDFNDDAKVKEIVEGIMKQMCADYHRPYDGCTFTGTEAGEYKWRWYNECTTLELLKLHE